MRPRQSNLKFARKRTIANRLRKFHDYKKASETNKTKRKQLELPENSSISIEVQNSFLEDFGSIRDKSLKSLGARSQHLLFSNKRRRIDGTFSEDEDDRHVTCTAQDCSGDKGKDDASGSGDDEPFSDDGMDNQTEASSTSTFHRRLGHILSSDEVNIINNQAVKFSWEMPALHTRNSNWIGTGEPIGEEDRTVKLNDQYKVHKHWLDIFGTSQSSSSLRDFFSLFSTYRDILHCNKKPFYLRGKSEDFSVMDAYVMHALNHVFKTRRQVIKNDAKLSKLDSRNAETIHGDAYLDQGFTRPKVLFLLPLASIAFNVVKRLIELTPPSNRCNVEQIDRFNEEFGAEDDDHDDANMGKGSQSQSKPRDFLALFGGNNNDHFMIGIKFTKRTIKLYNDFYSSDMIVCSPVGLITKIGDKEKDVDYLSSIEVAVIDHADVIAMQNWRHVNTVFEHMNCMPSKQHGTDVMRIRPWYLDGNARFYRQTIILGSYLNPDIHALFNRQCANYQGKLKLKTEHKGVLSKIMLPVKQVFERCDAPSIVDADDARFDHFCVKVFPKIKESLEGGIMMFISSYFEFVRIRNFLKSQNASFCLIGDYTKQQDISRSRLWFFEGKRKILLYTERAHFHHRYKIRGIKNLLIYSLPERKEFYPEVINMLDGSANTICNVVFSRFDQLKLERIAGAATANRMISSDKAAFVLC